MVVNKESFASCINCKIQNQDLAVGHGQGQVGSRYILVSLLCDDSRLLFWLLGFTINQPVLNEELYCIPPAQI